MKSIVAVAVASATFALSNPSTVAGQEIRVRVVDSASSAALPGALVALMDASGTAITEVLTAENAPDVKARVVVEGANHPVTPAADAVFALRHVVCLPDIVVNAGGVTVSYFEWTQNIQQFRWALERVNEELELRMVAA